MFQKDENAKRSKLISFMDTTVSYIHWSDLIQNIGGMGSEQSAKLKTSCALPVLHNKYEIGAFWFEVFSSH